MNKNIIIGLSFLACIFIFLPMIHADEGQLYKVDTDSLVLREAPDQNASILGELARDDEVTVFDEFYGWGKTYYNDQEAWVALYLLEGVDESTGSMLSKVDEKAVPLHTSDDIEKKEPADDTGDKSLAGYHFVIDPGHGGKDPGAIGNGIDEKALTLSTAKKVQKQLLDKGASVTLTRTDDTFIPLDERVRISNSTDTDAFISLHYNASEDSSVRGVHTFYHEGDRNQAFASAVQESLLSSVGLINRGVEQNDYKVLRDNTQMALLIELGFISNPEERDLVQTDSYQNEAAKGIVTGLEDYFK